MHMCRESVCSLHQVSINQLPITFLVQPTKADADGEIIVSL